MESTVEMMPNRKYSRDLLLQLRLHPFSLQKPTNLKEFEVVKDKLYLHQINNNTGSPNTSSYLNTVMDYNYSSTKRDPEFNCRYQRSLPECYSRNCSSFSASHKCNGLYQSSKTRSHFMSDYGPLLRKHSFQSLNESKYEYPSEDYYCSSMNGVQSIPWSKHCCGYSTNYWNGIGKSENGLSATTCSEEPSKNKKRTLPIIDPSNGKNILDGIVKSGKSAEKIKTGESSHVEQRSTHSDSGEPLSSEDRQSPLSEVRSNKAHECGDTGKDVTEDNKLDSQQDYTKIQMAKATKCCDSSNEDCCHSAAPSSEITGKAISETVNENCKKSLDSKCSNIDDTVMENADSVDSIDWDQFKVQDCPDDLLKMMRAEHQKLVLLRSFLLYKKHQLEESCRTLEERRLELAKWECSLAGRARRLQEKEGWLERKAADLSVKEERLKEKERRIVTKDQSEGDAPLENGGLDTDILADRLAKLDTAIESIFRAGDGPE